MKKRTNIYLVIITVLILCSSCQPILRLITGVSKPSTKNLNEVQAWSQVHLIDSDTIYAVDDRGFEKHFKNLPGFRIYTPNGDFIPSPIACGTVPQSVLEEMISQYEEGSSVSSEPTFEIKTKDLLTLTGEPTTLPQNHGRYKMILYHSIFIGKKFMKDVRELEEDARNSKYPIDIYHVNLDIREFWKDNEVTKK